MKKALISLLVLALQTAFFVTLFSFVTPEPPSVKIGDQIWMKFNLNVDRFRNGDIIPEAKTEGEWKEAGKYKQPAWCYYDNDPKYGEKYGKLYNWYAVNDPRGLAPKGWHIPSDAEWTELTDYLGGQKKAGAKMKSKEGWSDGGNGTNSSGFSGLPGGHRTTNGTFDAIGLYGDWWSSSEASTYDAWRFNLNWLGSVGGRVESNKERGFSVRCLRD